MSGMNLIGLSPKTEKISELKLMPLKINSEPTTELDSKLQAIEKRLREEMQQQFDELKAQLSNRDVSAGCPSPGKWDDKLNRCRGEDGKFMKSTCCDTKPVLSLLSGERREKAPAEYIKTVMNKYMGEYARSSAFHQEVNQLLTDNGIPQISPQQIRIFVNLHGYLTVRMNGQPTYKFI